jgi:hypothetical protein
LIARYNSRSSSAAIMCSITSSTRAIALARSKYSPTSLRSPTRATLSVFGSFLPHHGPAKGGADF